MRSKRYGPLIVGVSVAWTFWLIAGSLLLASWRAGVAAERARNAPLCAPGQVFARRTCQITLPGTLTKITGGELDVTVDGRNLRSSVTLSGPLPDASRGIPVEVTLYRSRIIHVEGETELSVDTDAAPGTKSWNYRNFGYCFLVFGTAAGLASALKTFQARSLEGG